MANDKRQILRQMIRQLVKFATEVYSQEPGVSKSEAESMALMSILNELKSENKDSKMPALDKAMSVLDQSRLTAQIKEATNNKPSE